MKFVVMRHQYVAYSKMNDTQSTEKFIREDGLIRAIDNIVYDFSSPRINTVKSFLIDLQLVNSNGIGLTKEGLIKYRNEVWI